MAKFKKKQKLLRRSEFTRTMDGGVKIVTPTVVFLGRSSETGKARVGFIVSKKVGGAVTRNLVKRRLREIYRVVVPSLAALDVVAIARVGADRCSYEDLHKNFTEGLHQLEAKLSRKQGAKQRMSVGSAPLQPVVQSDESDG